MAELKPMRLVMPGSSWETVKRIIRGYDAVQDRDNPTVEEVANIAGVQRPVISLNNNFLRDTGFILEGENKLTDLGIRYATGLRFSNGHLSVDALQELVREHPGLSQISSIIRARGEMKLEALRGEMIVIAGITDSAKAGTLRTIIDMLQEANVFSIDGDMVIYREGKGNGNSRVSKEEKPHEDHVSLPILQARMVPIALGIGRLVNVELPKDWSSKDLPKLLKMLELSLGEDMKP